MPDFDDWLDHQLRNVPVPPDLHRRLRAIGRSGGDAKSDSRLDAALRNVPVPGSLSERLRHIAHRSSRGLWPLMAIAAMAFVVVAVMLADYQAVPVRSKPVSPDQALPAAQSVADVASRVVEAAADADSFGRSQPADVASSTFVADSPPRTIMKDAGTDDSRLLGSPAARIARVLPIAWDRVTTAARALASVAQQQNQPLAPLGASGQLDPLPALDAYESTSAQGVSVPRVRGYDLMFELKHGEHPFVPPSVKELAVSHMPFTFRTTSYDDSVGAARRGRWPPAEDVKVEDFLAAQDYSLPSAPKNTLVLHAAASVSPLGEGGLHMLQLLVQAGGRAAVAREPQRLIVVVDTSDRMAVGARWPAVLRSLGTIAAALDDRDRITLVGAGQRPTLLLSDATADAMRSFIRSERLPRPAGRAQFSSAVLAACEAISNGGAAGNEHVALISSGREEDDDTGASRLSQALAQLTATTTSWQVIRLTPYDDDSKFAGTVRDAGGEVTLANSAAQVATAVVDKLDRQGAIVAQGVSLRLTFNPQVVTGYRLLGHVSNTLTGETAESLSVDFPARQQATAMYEMWVKPEGGDAIAAADLAWREPRTGRTRHATRIIRRRDLVGSFSQAPAWFQQGVIAAKAAEVLRGSYFAPSVRPFDQLRDLARQVDPALAAQSDFQALIELLNTAEKLR